MLWAFWQVWILFWHVHMKNGENPELLIYKRDNVNKRKFQLTK